MEKSQSHTESQLVIVTIFDETAEKVTMSHTPVGCVTNVTFDVG